MKKVMSKKLTKALVLTACAILLVAGTIMGTVAYLTAQVEVKNTFTYGNVTITMDERKTTVNGEFDGTSRVTVDNSYKLIPGQTYNKDTTIHVGTESERCYLFVKVTTINDLVSYSFASTESTESTEWKLVTGSDDVYYYAGVVEAGANVQVLKSFTVDSEAKAENLNSISEEAIVTVIGYAVQAAGFDTAAEAWGATFGKTTTDDNGSSQSGNEG